MSLAAGLLAALLCLTPWARGQDDGETVTEEQPYDVQHSSDSQGTPNPTPPDQANNPDMFKGGSSGGIPVRGRPATEDPLGPAVVWCEQGPDNPARHRPPNVKPFPAESNQYRHWFNSGLVPDGNCCAMAEFEGRDIVWACRRTTRAVANSAGCPYDSRSSTGTAPANGGVGANAGNQNLLPEIQARIQKIQSTVCEGLAKYSAANPGGNIDKNCDAMVQAYRDYIDFVDVALWFKGKFYARCTPTPRGEKLDWPAVPPPPPAK